MSSTAPTLTDVVTERVTHRTGRRVRNLKVEINPTGRLVLRGQAASYHVKQLAQQAAREALPDVPVENAIVVG
jgi:hypothetical protein